MSKHAIRKAQPVASGVLAYFPDALRVVANTSKVGNDQHNPGEPLHWAKEKSSDEADALLRHLSDHLAGETRDDDGVLHLGKVAWRALALLQRFLDANPEQRDNAHIPIGPPEPKAYDDMTLDEKAAFVLAKSREKYPDSVVVTDDPDFIDGGPTVYRVRGGKPVGWHIYYEGCLDEWLDYEEGWSLDAEQRKHARKAGLDIPVPKPAGRPKHRRRGV